jgi:TolB-like protein/DNA-binding winged helix-turn-helix (wHTH) protein/Flp pilus assembly protein TadD
LALIRTKWVLDYAGRCECLSVKQASNSPEVTRFGVFEADNRTGELRKRGLRIKLQEQPFQVLSLLLAQPGELVTRDELHLQLWPAINKLREALGDDAERPRYIETLPRRGYRFIAPISNGKPLPEPAESPGAPVTQLHASAADSVRGGRSMTTALIVLMGILVLGALVLAYRLARRQALPAAATLSASPIRSLAVLPLRNLSGDKDQEYFADGMTDELITDLGQVGALRVISHTSVMHYKGTSKTLPQIGRELGADAIVEGTVFRSGNRVRITAQLLDARTDRHLWAHEYERDLRDVITMQDEVARDIATEIRIKLTPQQQVRLSSTRRVNPEAYEAYLMGRYYWNKRTVAGVGKAIQYFQIATEKDPGYALAYAGLADAYVVLVPWEVRPTKEALPEARAAARRALQIDSTLAGPHATLGMSNLYDLNWLGAEGEFKRAIELNASNATAHEWYSLTLASIGRWDEATEEAERAQVLDPHSLVIGAVVGWVFLLSGQYQQAIGQEQRTLQMDPDFSPALLYLGLAYDQKGRYQEATAVLERASKLPGGSSPIALAELARTYALSGQRGRAIEVLKELRQVSKRRYVPSFKIAVVYAALGENGRAFAWLEKAYNDHDQGMSNIKVDPRLDPLRSDPRYQDLMRRMNFPQ